MVGFSVSALYVAPFGGHGPPSPPFEILSPIRDITTIAVGGRIRNITRLVARYGSGRWLKRSGVALIRLLDGTILTAELHWYEAHGIGRREMKLKSYLDRR